MLRQGLTRIAWLMAGGVLVYTWLVFASDAGAPATVALASQQASVIQDATASSPVLHYQGRLLDPTTGQPKADGSYSMAFRLYSVATAGSPLWTETKAVSVTKGLFTTLLGDTTALELAQFDGRELYLGVSVGADPEATPRQRIAYVAYAIYAENAGHAATAGSADSASHAATAGSADSAGHAATAGSADSASHAATADTAVAANSASNAEKLDGLDSTAFALAAHTHDGAAIVSGTVAEPFIDPAIARDTEVLPTVLAGDGAGSGLDADTLDGIDSSGLAPAVHSHTGADIVNNTITSDDIEDTTRNLGFPANALNYDKSSTVITQYATGLLWQADFASPAYLMLPRPLDWDGTSAVTLQLYFAAFASGTGNVDFFIRPRAFDPGDTFVDASSFDGAAVALSQASQIGRQTFTIPASRFGAKSLWVITLQREGSEETYTGDVILYAVDVSYTAVR